MAQTELLFRDDAYLAETPAKVIAVRGDGGILLDRTVFYATSGGQPGDSGVFRFEHGRSIAIATAVTSETKDDIVHLPAPGAAPPAVGDSVIAAIDFDRRLKLMRMHTACHLLSVICPFPITGAAVGEEESRVDFDLPDASFTREFATAELMKLVEADHPVFTRLISEADLDANAGLVKSKNVRPPRGAGVVRLVCIGDEASIDSQPCGGTHVRSTGKVGQVHVGKIEKKGRENRRFRLRFGSPSS